MSIAGVRLLREIAESTANAATCEALLWAADQIDLYEEDRLHPVNATERVTLRLEQLVAKLESSKGDY
jgi:hypothetical protein